MAQMAFVLSKNHSYNFSKYRFVIASQIFDFLITVAYKVMFFTKQWLEFEKHAHRWRGGHPRVPFKDRFTVLFFPKFTLELRTSVFKTVGIHMQYG